MITERESARGYGGAPQAATAGMDEEPTEKPNTFFSKDKNQIEKFPLSDFFPDYNLL